MRPFALRNPGSQQGAPLVLDVRTREEYARGHLSGAVLVETPLPPLTPAEYATLRKKLEQIGGSVAPDRPIWVYCKKGKRAGMAVRILRHMGFDAVSLGGVEQWRAVEPFFLFENAPYTWVSG